MKRLIIFFFMLFVGMFCFGEKVNAEEQKLVWHNDSAERIKESQKNILKISKSVPKSKI